MNKSYALILVAATVACNTHAADVAASARAKYAAMNLKLTAQVAEKFGSKPAAPKPAQDDFGYAPQAPTGKTLVRNWTKDVGTGAGLSAALGISTAPAPQATPDFQEQTLVVVQDGDELRVQPAQKSKAKRVINQTTVVSPGHLEDLPAEMVADTLFGAPALRTRTLAKTTHLGETTVIHSGDLAALEPEDVLNTGAGYKTLSPEQTQKLLHLEHLYDEKLTKQAWQITFAKKEAKE